MMQRIVILGSTAPEIVKLIAARLARHRDELEIVGFLDDDSSRHGTVFMGYPILGDCELVRQERLRNALVINNVAKTTAIRSRIWKKLEDMGAQFYTAVHPSVDTAFATIGTGCILQERVIVGPEVTIGSQCLISFGAIIAHESTLESCCFVAPGVVINGRIKIKQGAFIGAGAVILPNVTVGEWSIVGAGSVVTEDVPPRTTVFGSPARVIAIHSPQGGAE